MVLRIVFPFLVASGKSGAKSGPVASIVSSKNRGPLFASLISELWDHDYSFSFVRVNAMSSSKISY